MFEDIYVRSLLLPLGNKLRDLKSVGTTLIKILPNLRGAQDPHEEEVKLHLEIKFLQEHVVQIEKDQLVSLELYRLETGTSHLISSRKAIISPSRSFARSTSSHPRVNNLTVSVRITEMESGSAPGDNPTAQLYHKLRGQDRTLWSREQMQRLWVEHRCFKCGGTEHQSADCNNTPVDPKHFLFLNLVSETNAAHEMEKTITKLLEFNLIEPSSSLYSNPVFLVTKPSLRNGSPGVLRFVWDGRSVNRAIKSDSSLIPRVEDLVERIARLKHEVNAKEMWISTLDLRTSF